MEKIKMTAEEREEARRAVEAWEEVKKSGEKITLEITPEELDRLETALNRYAVDMSEEAKKHETGDDIKDLIKNPNIWRKEWSEAGDLFVKLYEEKTRLIDAKIKH